MRQPFPTCAFIVAALVLPAFAKTIPITGEGVQVDLPDDWKIESRPGFALSATAPDGKSAFSLRIVPNRSEARIDESFYLEAMKRARQQKADQDHGSLIIIEAGTAAINGIPASYIHTEEPMPDGLTDYGRGFLVAANGKFYSISTDASDPFMDQKMNQIAGTFRFDSPPVLPDKDRPFYRRLAQVVGAVLCIGFLGGFAAWVFVQRRKQEMEGPR